MRNGSFLKDHRWDIILVVLIILEMAFMLYFPKGTLPNWINEIGFTATSILIGVVVLAKYYGREPAYVSAPWQTGLRAWSALSILCLGLAVFGYHLAALFKAMPINPAHSDVIPTIEIAVRRLLSGETVYAAIDKWGYQLPLTYLPMQWLPYTIAEGLGMDYRWIAVAIFFLDSILVVLRSNRVSPGYGIATALLLLYTSWVLMKNDTGIAGMTVELMVAGYYMLLVSGIGGRNPWLRGAVIALCLMSRYSLVLWLPLWAFVEYTRGGRKDFFRSCLVAALLVLGIYIIPFLSRDWGAFMRGYHYYSQAAIGEWGNLDEHRVPFQLDHGVGFARLFYLKLWEYSVPDRLLALQKAHLAVCLGSTVIMGIWYWFVRHRIHARIFLMASFKIYLSLFLAFIQVPYPYLMITAAAVSIAIFAESSRWRESLVR